jgi:transcriptional regulator with XRE-family HTH domain
MDHPLRKYRQDHEMTRAQLADKLGVGRPTVFRWESGTRKIDESLLPRITERTGIPAKELRPDLLKRHEEMFGGSQ